MNGIVHHLLKIYLNKPIEKDVGVSDKEVVQDFSLH